MKRPQIHPQSGPDKLRKNRVREVRKVGFTPTQFI